jgi:hypothetical protein
MEKGRRDRYRVCRGLLTHSAKLREVLLGSLVLLILVDPLVEISLEEVDASLVLEQARPELLLELLLLQSHLDVLAGVDGLCLLGLDLSEELKVDVILLLLGGGGAGEGDAGGLDV